MHQLNFTQEVSFDQLYAFIVRIDGAFEPPLSSRVSLNEYAEKLLTFAKKFAFLDENNQIVGAVCLYCNDPEKMHAYIPFLAVLEEYRGQGITKSLFKKVEVFLKTLGFNFLALETWLGGDALPYYIKSGFFIHDAIKDRPQNGVSLKLKKCLQLKEDHFPFAATPLQYSQRLGDSLGIDLYLKRDDLFAATGGGSKARKLKFILKKAHEQGCDAVVTAGGAQSNHVRATALMCAELGMKMSAIIHDDENADSVGNLKLTKLSGAKLSFVEMKEVKSAMDRELIRYIQDGHRPYYIWGGGHSVEGAYAYYRAAYELKNQLSFSPDFIVVASGTGTTQAGLEVAIKELFPHCRILGVSVARDNKKGTGAIMASANELIDALGNKVEPIDALFFDDTMMGKGYEDVFPELLHLIHTMASDHGLILDPTYSGKAFYGLAQYIERGIIPLGSKVIFWHTGSLMNALASKII